MPELPAEGERLQKIISRAGIASRRVAEDMIVDGRVLVNGATARLGQRVDPSADTVSVDGATIGIRPDLVYHLLHKPAGVVTTSDDPQGRPTVIELVPSDTRVYPVGRLDLETEGLLLLTNDGDLTHRLTHPSFGVDKEYLAEIEGSPTRGALRTLRQGVELEDGMTAPAKVSELQPGLLRIVIHEGRNRQVRRMCEAVGHPVRRLVRTRIGPLVDRDLKAGESRQLDQAEVRALERATVVEPGETDETEG